MVIHGGRSNMQLHMHFQVFIDTDSKRVFFLLFLNRDNTIFAFKQLMQVLG
uniref:Uncharacterized protein n=1 Tax=Arundo donax TaxID=35708 RepID=A0A0A9E8R3_ARUDO